MPNATDTAKGLTQERLVSLVAYDPESGMFTWVSLKSKKAASLIGKRAGTYHDISGYWKICIDRKIYKASRLAWLYMTGSWPSGDVDHINGNRGDDRFANLRDATNAQNGANAKRRSTNTSGFKGVYFDKAKKKWASQITVNYKNIFLGRYATAEEAAAVYWKAATKYFGDFARAA